MTGFQRVLRFISPVSLLMSVLLLPVMARAQGNYISGQVINAATGKPAAFALVRVCPLSGGGIPCSPLSLLFSDPALSQPVSNPYTTDQAGNYSFAVAAGYFIVQVTPVAGTTYSYLYSVSGGGGSALFYQTMQLAGVSQTQQPKLNFLPVTGISVANNSGNTSTDVSLLEASTSQYGASKCDGVSILCPAGVFTAPGSHFSNNGYVIQSSASIGGGIESGIPYSQHAVQTYPYWSGVYPSRYFDFSALGETVEQAYAAFPTNIQPKCATALAGGFPAILTIDGDLAVNSLQPSQNDTAAQAWLVMAQYIEAAKAAGCQLYTTTIREDISLTGPQEMNRSNLDPNELPGYNQLVTQAQNPPSESITTSGASSNTALFTGSNQWIAGLALLVNPGSCTVNTFLNGKTVQVISTGLSPTQFEAAFVDFTHGDVSPVSDTCTLTAMGSAFGFLDFDKEVPVTSFAGGSGSCYLQSTAIHVNTPCSALMAQYWNNVVSGSGGNPLPLQQRVSVTSTGQATGNTAGPITADRWTQYTNGNATSNLTGFNLNNNGANVCGNIVTISNTGTGGIHPYSTDENGTTVEGVAFSMGISNGPELLDANQSVTLRLDCSVTPWNWVAVGNTNYKPSIATANGLQGTVTIPNDVSTNQPTSRWLFTISPDSTHFLPTNTGSSGSYWSGAGTLVVAATGSVSSITTTSPITGGPITTTGTIACPTCVTSAAALTANQLVLGQGSQASATLGSLGTTTTVLHGNAAGPPSFGAVNLAADVSGSLPNANLANPSTTVNGQTCTLGSTCTVTATASNIFQVNATPLTSASTINYVNGVGNGGINITNPSLGNVNFDLSKPIAGSGAGFTTGPTSGCTNSGAIEANGTGGQIKCIASPPFLNNLAQATALLILSGTSTASGSSYYGAYSGVTAATAATTAIGGYYSNFVGPASTTTTNVFGFGSNNVKGSGSTWTNYEDFLSLTAASHSNATNAAAFADNAAFTGYWFLNQSGTDPSTLGGKLTAANLADAGVLSAPCLGTDGSGNLQSVSCETTGIAATWAGVGGSTVTCVNADGSPTSCTSARGSLKIVGGTATTGSVAAGSWSTESSNRFCVVTQNGNGSTGTASFDLGHTSPSATGFSITAGITVLGATIFVDYVCLI